MEPIKKNEDDMPDDIDDFVFEAEQLEAGNGTLFDEETLKYNFPHLYATMKDYPKRFTHIKQDRVSSNCEKKNIDEWVSVAEILESTIGGFLPDVAWLKKYDYIGLLQAIRKYPEKFVHILRQIEWEKAVKIAKKNDGLLPDEEWLRDHGYARLASFIEEHPDRFRPKNERKLSNK
jgi:hypothetical protein